MSLLDRYDALLLDLDGTVYRGATAIPGATDAVAAVRERDLAVRFVTNNASRAPADVAGHLADIGIPATSAEISTSAQAAAKVLSENTTGKVLVVGAEALELEVKRVGLATTRTADDAAAVVQGLSRETGWRDLAEAAVALSAGAYWVACNVDNTLPTERGILPGNGSFVTVLRTTTGREPVVAGKPARPLLDEAVRAADARRALTVGDRLDTDIAGAVNAGLDSLLVLTGASNPAELIAGEVRPTYLAADVRAVVDDADRLAIGPKEGWNVTDGVVRGDGDPLDLLRALCAEPKHEAPRAGDDTAAAALAHLGLPHELA